MHNTPGITPSLSTLRGKWRRYRPEELVDVEHVGEARAVHGSGHEEVNGVIKQAIFARADGDQLVVDLWGRSVPAEKVVLQSRLLSVERSGTAVRQQTPTAPGARRFVRSAAATGYRVVTYRVTVRDGRELRRERLSDDSYPSMPRVLRYASESR